MAVDATTPTLVLELRWRATGKHWEIAWERPEGGIRYGTSSRRVVECTTELDDVMTLRLVDALQDALQAQLW